jgi:hypothetical protein
VRDYRFDDGVSLEGLRRRELRYNRGPPHELLGLGEFHKMPTRPRLSVHHVSVPRSSTSHVVRFPVSLLAGALACATVVSLPSMMLTDRAAYAASTVVSARDLDFTASELRLFRDPETGKHYWYLTYEVVNNTGQDRRFAPRIEMFYDEGLIVRQGEGVPSSVVKQLKEFLGNELLEDQFEILGTVLQGKEHAKSGLAVFRVPELSDLDKKTAFRHDDDEHLDDTEITVFVQGLSKDSRKEPNPKGGGDVTLRRTTRLDYVVPGNPIPKGNVPYPIVHQDDSTFR